jgi:hypothetical protein
VKTLGRYVARAALSVAAAALVLGAIALRVIAEGRAELRAGEAAYAEGDFAASAVHARRAAVAYVPFAAHMGSAYERLRTLAREAEARGDHDAALFAWRAMRSAAIASRWFVAPRGAERREADGAIARLSAATREPSGAPYRSAGAQSVRRLNQILASDEGPSTLGGLLLLGGFACFIAGGVWITRSRVQNDGATALAVPRPPVFLIALGIIGWCVGWLLG